MPRSATVPGCLVLGLRGGHSTILISLPVESEHINLKVGQVGGLTRGPWLSLEYVFFQSSITLTRMGCHRSQVPRRCLVVSVPLQPAKYYNLLFYYLHWPWSLAFKVNDAFLYMRLFISALERMETEYSSEAIIAAKSLQTYTVRRYLDFHLYKDFWY